MTDPIVFVASVQKVQTLVDQGLRVTLDLPEDSIMQMAMLAECKRHGVALTVSATPINNTGDDSIDGKKSRPAVKSLRA